MGCSFLTTCFLVAFGLLLFQQIHVRANSEQEQENISEQKNETAKPKQVTFDDNGILTINGVVGGTSEPIVVDRKPLPNHCATKPYYVFSLSRLVHKSECQEGIIFCYDGQLVEERVRENFVLPKMLNKDNDISRKCKEFNGFKMAVHHLNSTNIDERNETTFLEIKTSFQDKSYYFSWPVKSKKIDLWLGSPESILAGVRLKEKQNKLVRPVRVWINSTTQDGVFYPEDIDKPGKGEEDFMEDFTSLPDYKNGARFLDKPHLNMLYMDFRARELAPQMMMAIVPEKNYEVIVKVTSNVVKECKSAWKQKSFALHAYNNNETVTEYALTIESGIEDWKTTGRKKGSARSQLESTEEGKITIDETSSLSGLQKETEHISRNSESNTESSGTSDSSSTSFGGSANVNIGTPQAGGQFEAGGDVANEQTNSQTDSFTKYSARENSKRESETTITSNAQILENAYKTTSTSENTQKQNSMSSQSVKVPPGKILYPEQMTMDCDGQEVKIPWMKFRIEGEDSSDEIVTEPDYST